MPDQTEKNIRDLATLLAHMAEIDRTIKTLRAQQDQHKSFMKTQSDIIGVALDTIVAIIKIPYSPTSKEIAMKGLNRIKEIGAALNG